MSSRLEVIEAQPTISRPPTGWERFGERAFRGACFAFAWLTIVVVAMIVWEIGLEPAAVYFTASLDGFRCMDGRKRLTACGHVEEIGVYLLEPMPAEKFEEQTPQRKKGGK